MEKAKLYAMIVLASFAIGACNNSPKSGTDNANTENTNTFNSRQKDNGNLSKDATNFMVSATNGGMTEVAMGKMAEKRATLQRVKDFATMIIHDHQQATGALRSIAKGTNITLPDSLSSDSKDKMQKLTGEQGIDFDRTYMQMMVDDHQKDVKDFKSESLKVKDADLHQWLSSTLGTLEKHLDSANAINNYLKDHKNLKIYPRGEPHAN
jgi:putative membrane protein